ncbi:hypothetical protein RG959_20500 [Domibacillus sp. 8LH]|uniref:hypothetical protein n=1 Tax=Domibacillus sp. 8LH TaxID=3073900 RepID=UPI00316B3737
MIDSMDLTIIAVCIYGIFYFLWTSRNKETARKRNQEIQQEFKGEGKYGILFVFLLFVPVLLFIGIFWLIIA